MMEMKSARCIMYAESAKNPVLQTERSNAKTAEHVMVQGIDVMDVVVISQIRNVMSAVVFVLLVPDCCRDKCLILIFMLF